MNCLRSLLLASGTLLATQSLAADVKIVSWNVAASPHERLLARASDYKKMADTLSPDVIVLIELTGRSDVKAIADAIGWQTYYATVSDGQVQGDEIHMSLEVGVLSKIPITSVTEFDPKPEGHIHPVMTNSKPDGDTSIPVKEMPLKGIDMMGLAATDRGTLRVDLANGLTVFPVHLKSNSNDACFAADDAIKALKKLGLPAVPALQTVLDNGSEVKAKADKDNAFKRERVIAATKTVADQAVADGRRVLIAGDWNTSFEPGKFGQSFDDCSLTAFSCAKAPFPASACTGDGFDDTFAIMTMPLVGSQKWTMLTKDLGRTFKDTEFADKAIDHITVPAAQAASFATPKVGPETFGSDHFPIFTVWTAGP
ncbi:endonuclease/exonuclease/phosphatase family protein [Rhizobium etli bv. phaseoli str. IE4803]|nr:endonuclease/exonuclease/phosphatase family protein [Rhizobium etli bv. phaseoli str. IE4803]